MVPSQQPPSVTATENACMAAVMAEGHTRIRNAAAEPHVQDLCNMLVSMGANISGIGTGTLEFEGVKKLKGTRFRLGSDHIHGNVHRAVEAELRASPLAGD